MKITVIGTGYVGLVTGACLADSGNHVVCVDIDQAKIDALTRGEIPIYEPGLRELVDRNRGAGRLSFTTEAAAAVSASRLVFLAVGTPPLEDGSADVKYLVRAVEDISGHLPQQSIVVIKSTVPVGTNAKITGRLKELTGRDCHVCSNPEFLKEGAAIDDFLKPDRVVVGTRDRDVANVMRTLYAPYLRTEKPLLVMSPESSEMVKYAANAMLATKISFINEIANLCQRTAADVDDVRRGIGHDSRIGFAFLFPGVGYGGSCFPKDVRALVATARGLGIEPRLLTAVDEVNTRQKTVLLEKIRRQCGEDLRGKVLAIWGLSFKPRTDDVREAPALALIDQLLESGATIRAHDPEAMENVRKLYGDRLSYFQDQYDALDGVDALVLMTEWKEFVHPDFDAMRSRMRAAVVFDGRNVYSPDTMREAGFTYHSIGRASVMPR